MEDPWLGFTQTFSQQCETSLRWLKRYLRASDLAGMSGSAGQITAIQSLFVPHSGCTKPHSFPKAPLCHELSLNATRLSIDLLAMHFLSCFDVIVESVYGRFQIKLWRVLAFKPVISDWWGGIIWPLNYHFFSSLFFFPHFFWEPQTGLCDSSAQAVSNAHRYSSMKPPPPPLPSRSRHCRGAHCLLGLGRWLCQEYEWDKTYSPTVQRDRSALRLHTSSHFHVDSCYLVFFFMYLPARHFTRASCWWKGG